jgi:hypothetical protein
VGGKEREGRGVRTVRRIGRHRGRTEHEDLEDEQRKTDAVEGERPGLSSTFVRAVCTVEKPISGLSSRLPPKVKDEEGRKTEERTENEQKSVLVNQIRQPKVQRRERQNQRRNDGVR